MPGPALSVQVLIDFEYGLKRGNVGVGGAGSVIGRVMISICCGSGKELVIKRPVRPLELTQGLPWVGPWKPRGRRREIK